MGTIFTNYKSIVQNLKTGPDTMFNLFYRINEPAIICALPDGGMLPWFLRGRSWGYAGKVVEISDSRAEDNNSLFDQICYLNGFYIYIRNDLKSKKTSKVSDHGARQVSDRPVPFG